jgi:hypothetical protein
MTASSNPTPSVGHQANLTEVPRISPARVIDFFEAGHRLLTDSESIAQKSGMDRQIKEPAIRRARSEDLADAFEQGGYWLMGRWCSPGWPLGSSAFETSLCLRASRQLM